MKCPGCAQENRAAARYCAKCGADLTCPPVWFPDWKWHLKTLSLIYISLTAAFFALSWLRHKLPPPYDQRTLPQQMTPWLNPKKIPAP